MQSHYDYSQVVRWIESKGIELYGSGFRVLETDHAVIYRLIAYFLKDAHGALQFGLDLTKGVLLSGPVGCGKTALMTVMKHLAAPENKFIVKPCRDISFEFIDGGYGIIHKYSNGKLYESNPKTYCFDDLGLENNIKYYGNACNVMAEVLLSRYDLFLGKKIRTHLTTNLSASEIETHYGSRVRSRLRQLCNLIAFPNDSKDKR